ncbi:MAG: hypothetical protein IKZ46_00795 [Victivallales bacterium]|nr:hypothetical protein [Victivallales bacterium]
MIANDANGSGGCGGCKSASRDRKAHGKIFAKEVISKVFMWFDLFEFDFHL